MAPTDMAGTWNKNPMTCFRVIHVIIRPDGGGAERLVRELTRRLPDHGVESKALYFWNPSGVELSPREINLGLAGNRDPRAVLRLRRALRRERSEQTPILVHGHLTWPLYFLPLALARQSMPMIYTEHNTENRRRRYSVLQPLERMIYGQYQRILCVSQGAKASLGTWLGPRACSGKLEVVLNGSRLLPFTPRHRRRGRGVQLVSVGSLSPQKGFDIALRAVAALAGAVESYTIVGEGRERPRLEALARELGILDKVYFPGYVDDVTPYFHKADLGIIPSRWEGFGLVAVEALSTGLPLVASDVNGMREVLDGCPAAHLVKPGDPEALAAKIQHAVANLIRNDELAMAARKHSETFSMDSMVARYANLYKNLWALSQASHAD